MTRCDYLVSALAEASALMENNENKLQTNLRAAFLVLLLLENALAPLLWVLAGWWNGSPG